MNRRSTPIQPRSSLLGDVAVTAILFGGLALLENRLAWMRDRTPSVLA